MHTGRVGGTTVLVATALPGYPYAPDLRGSREAARQPKVLETAVARVTVGSPLSASSSSSASATPACTH